MVKLCRLWATRMLPPPCEPCEFRETCHGGCGGRRRLQGALDELDMYCPIIRGERPRLDIKMAVVRDSQIRQRLHDGCNRALTASLISRIPLHREASERDEDARGRQE